MYGDVCWRVFSVYRCVRTPILGGTDSALCQTQINFRTLEFGPLRLVWFYLGYLFVWRFFFEWPFCLTIFWDSYPILKFLGVQMSPRVGPFSHVLMGEYSGPRRLDPTPRIAKEPCYNKTPRDQVHYWNGFHVRFMQSENFSICYRLTWGSLPLVNRLKKFAALSLASRRFW